MVYYFNDYFSKVSSVNSKATKLSNQKLALNFPRFRPPKYQRSIKYKDTKIRAATKGGQGGDAPPNKNFSPSPHTDNRKKYW